MEGGSRHWTDEELARIVAVVLDPDVPDEHKEALLRGHDVEPIAGAGWRAMAELEPFWEQYLAQDEPEALRRDARTRKMRLRRMGEKEKAALAQLPRAHWGALLQVATHDARPYITQVRTALAVLETGGTLDDFWRHQYQLLRGEMQPQEAIRTEASSSATEDQRAWDVLMGQAWSTPQPASRAATEAQIVQAAFGSRARPEEASPPGRTAEELRRMRRDQWNIVLASSTRCQELATPQEVAEALLERPEDRQRRIDRANQLAAYVEEVARCLDERDEDDAPAQPD
jgi:hypothetical protein